MLAPGERAKARGEEGIAAAYSDHLPALQIEVGADNRLPVVRIRGLGGVLVGRGYGRGAVAGPDQLCPADRRVLVSPHTGVGEQACGQVPLV